MTLTPRSGFQLLAATPAAGFALQNGTPNILTWTAPNDGNDHTVLVIASLNVSVLEVGGLIQTRTVDPVGGVATVQLFAGSLAAGSTRQQNVAVVGPGTTVQINQNSALTGGAATVYVSIWGS